MLNTNFARSIFAAVALTAAINAQGSLKVDKPVVNSGDDVIVTFADPARTNASIEVRISNGSLVDPRSATIWITTDANGNGTGTWTAPNSGWSDASFNANNSNEAVVSINTSNN